jgi:hypothetical protein
VTFAQSVGLYPKDGKPEDFSFSDTYDPVSFTGARVAEARVWNLFKQIGGGKPVAVAVTRSRGRDRNRSRESNRSRDRNTGNFDDAFFLSYAQGKNLSNRMPLFVEAAKPLAVNDTMWNMRTHFEVNALNFNSNFNLNIHRLHPPPPPFPLAEYLVRQHRPHRRQPPPARRCRRLLRELALPLAPAGVGKVSLHNMNYML